MGTTGWERTLSPRELAEQLGGSPARYKQLYKEGQIPGEPIGTGRKVKFNAQEVLSAIHEKGIKVRGIKGGEEESAEDQSPEQAIADKIEIEAAKKAQIVMIEHVWERLYRETQVMHTSPTPKASVRLVIALQQKIVTLLESYIEDMPEDPEPATTGP